MVEAIQEISVRHETLRTTFHIREGVPVQVIVAAPVSVEVVHITSDMEGLPLQEALRIAREFECKPYVLSQDAPFRALVIVVGTEDYVIALSAHHIVFDGWSLQLFCNELQELYNSKVLCKPAQLPTLEAQFSDFASGQVLADSQAFQHQLDYWVSQLSGAPAALALPTDRAPQLLDTRPVGVYEMELPGLGEMARHLALQEGTSVFVVVLTVLNVLLAKYSGQNDICVGISTDDRSDPKYDTAIGFFINTVVIRTQVQTKTSFIDLLHVVHEQMLNAYENQDIPFDHVVAAVNPERRVGSSPLFQVSLDRKMQFPQLDLIGVNARSLNSQPCAAKVDLAFEVADQGADLYFRIEYDAALFDPDTIAKISNALAGILQNVVASPSSKVSEFSLLNERERAHINAFNAGPRADYDHRVSFLERFLEHCVSTPDATAVHSGSKHLSYAQLDEQSQALASKIISHAGVGTVVAILLDRGVEMAIATVAVIRSGTVFLVLDCHQPDARLLAMIQVCQPKCLVVDDHQHVRAKRLLAQASIDIPTVRCDEPPGQSGVRPFIGSKIDPSAPAYVVFTSGSTGIPKGAVVSHLGMLNHLHGKIWSLQMSKKDIVAQIASPSFDIYVWQFLTSLLVGASVEVISEDVAYGRGTLLRYVEERAITVLEVVPSHLRQILLEVDADFRLSSLRWLVVTGDVATSKLIQTWFDQFPTTPVLNVYGPAECSDDVTFQPIYNRPNDEPIPIGRPLPNCYVYILDANMEALPLGVVGDIWVGGDCVGIGYLANPRSTAIAFQPDPWRPGRRLYRTGDLGRWRRDGTIDFLGRSDSQVKIRGARVELAEVKRALELTGMVVQAEALLTQDDGDRLIAFITLSPETAGKEAHRAVGDLRRVLQRSLPAYMMPADIIILDQFPITGNGKIDMQSLRAKVPARRFLATESSAMTPTEARIMDIWNKVLLTPVPSRDANFFELGGHSLLAIQIISLLKETLAKEIRLGDFFSNPTVVGIATLVDEIAESVNSRVPKSDTVVPNPCYASFIQERLWVLDQLEPGQSRYNVPIAFKLRGSIDVARLQAVLQRVVLQHESLRTTFIEEPGGLKQVVHDFVAQDWQFCLAHNLDDEQLEIHLNRCARLPFDLQQGPLLRAYLVVQDNDEAVMFLVLHHAICDEVSLFAMLDDFRAEYEAGTDHSPCKAAPTYREFALLQRDLRDSGRFADKLEYWRTELAGAPQLLEFPQDKSPSVAPRDHGGRVSLPLDQLVSADLSRMATSEGLTLYSLVAASLLLLLSKESGQSEVCLAVPITNRDEERWSRTVGCFLNTIVLRGGPRDGEDFRTLAKRIGQAHARHLDAADVPFDLVVEAIRPIRAAGRNPLAQVSLVVADSFKPVTWAQSLSVQPLHVSTNTAKFDITFGVTIGTDGLVCHAEFNVDLVDHVYAERLLARWAGILKSIADDPGQQVDSLTRISAAETRQIHSWNSTNHDFCTLRTLQDLLLQQLRDVPRASPAIITDDCTFTYGELDTVSDAVAVELCKLDIGIGDLVAVYAERGIDLFVAALGVLKAGAVYLPLDPSYPSQRLSFVLQDASPRALLTTSNLPQLPYDGNATIVLLDLLERDGCQPWRSEVQETDPAYVIYTSGTTGKPKGAVVSHAAIANRLLWMQKQFPLTRQDRVLHKTPIGFDVSVWELFWALTQGATIVVARPGGHADPEYLQALVQVTSVTTVHFVPPMLERFLDFVPHEGLPTLKWIICSGQALPLDLVKRCTQKLPGAGLWNLYGPTEAAIDVTFMDCQQIAGYRTVPIGKPISNIRIHILDASLQQVPIGHVGEIYISGVGVGLGYLNQEELTRDRFVQDPFDGGTMYRTGDLGRYFNNGNIEYLGRQDQQVKIRGFRVELEEISSNIRQIAGIRDAVVLLTGFHLDQLSAFCVPHPGVNPGPDLVETLKNELSRQLPEHMIPAKFIFIDQVPLTENGKVNRSALVNLTADTPTSVEVQPLTDLERRVASLWSDVLKCEVLAGNDDFFALGGHSLTAMQLISRINSCFGIRMPLTAVFTKRTVSSMAAFIESSPAFANGGCKKVFEDDFVDIII